MIKNKSIKENPVLDYVAAISCGIVDNEILVDLDYEEDSRASVDANFVVTKNSGLSEIQISGEESTFPQQSALDMIEQSKQVIQNIFKIQENAIRHS